LDRYEPSSSNHFMVNSTPSPNLKIPRISWQNFSRVILVSIDKTMIVLKNNGECKLSLTTNETNETYAIWRRCNRRKYTTLVRVLTYPLKAAFTATISTEFMAGIDYSSENNQGSCINSSAETVLR